ncbi:phage tail tape measure protein [Streptomyces brevispora]|uniref:phage tail tape measure protein n=1 Tax=Streptomyces brevispora TaxID=887462 RepID=UPI0037246CF6
MDTSARIRIELDDAGVAQQSRVLGQRIAKAIEPATRKITQDIQQAISKARPKVAVAGDLKQFQQALRAATGKLKPVKVPVTANLSQFQKELRSAGTRLKAIKVPVGANLTQLQRELRSSASQLKTIKVPVGANLTQFQRELRTAASQLRPIKVPVGANLAQFQRELRTAASQLRPIKVPVTADLRQLQQGLRAANTPIRVPVTADMRQFQQGLRTAGSQVRPTRVPVTANTSGFRSGIAGLANSVLPINVPVRADTSGFQKAVLAAGAAVVAMLGGTVGLSANFEAGMNAVKAVTQATTKEFKSLEDQARYLGATTKYTATQAAEGMKFLGMTGYKTKEILAAMPSTLDLAAAANMDLGRAADIVSNIMTGYGKKATEVVGINDMLVKTFISSNVDVEMLGQSFKYVGGTAKAMGLKITDTAAILGALGDSGLQAAMGGTGLRRVLTKLQNPTKAASEVFEKYGVKLTTASGEMRPAIDLIRELALAGLQGGDAIKAFGDRGGPAMTAITGQLPKIDKLRASLQDVDGVAHRVAATMMEGAKGGFLIFKSAVEGLAISIGKAGLLAAVTRVTTAASGMVDGLNRAAQSSLPAVFQSIGASIKNAFSSVSNTGIFDGLKAALSGLWEVTKGLMPALSGFAAIMGPTLVGVLYAAAAALQLLAGALRPLGKFLQDNATAVATFGAVLAGMMIGAKIVGMFMALSGVLTTVRTLIVGVRGAMMLLNLAMYSNPIGLVVIAIAGLIAGLVYLYNNVEPVRRVIDGLFSSIAGFVMGVGAWFGKLPGLIGSGLSAVGDFFSGMFDSASSAVSSGMSSVGQFFSNGFETAKQAVSAGIDATVQFFVALPGRIGNILAALPGVLYEAFTSAVAGLAIVIITALALVYALFFRVPTIISNALVSLGAYLVDAFLRGLSVTSSLVTGWLTATVAFFQALPGRLGSALVSLGSAISSAFTAAATATTAAVSSFATGTVAFFVALPGRIGSGLSSLGSMIGGAFSRAAASAKATVVSFVTAVVAFHAALPGRIGGALSSVGSKIAAAFSSATRSARSAVSSLIGNIVSLFSTLPGRIVASLGDIGSKIIGKIKSGLPSSVRGLLPFANGGIVNGPTAALIGEAGPEVVIPLTRPARARQLAAQSGLLDILGTAKPSQTARAGRGNFVSLDSGDGRDLIRGMINGILAMAGPLVSATTMVMRQAVDAARNTLGIHSPSTVLAAIGRDTGRGFIIGLTGTAAQIKQTTERIAKSITAAFKGRNTKIDDRLVAMVQTGNTKLTTLAAQRDALVKRIADAQKFAADTTKAALQAFSLSSLVQGQEGFNASTITAGLTGAVKQVKAFTAQVNALAKRGLRKDIVSQLIGLGPEQGAALATALSRASKGQLKKINTLQGQLAKSAGTLGTTSSDLLYDAGKRAGDGLLAGLKDQKKKIEQLMLDIAKGMQSAIRAELKIHSPSVAMRWIGDMAGAGLELGLVGRIGALAAAARSAAQSMVGAVSSQLGGMPDLSAGFGSAVEVGGPRVPLTRMQRLRQARADGATPGSAAVARTVTNHFTINETGDGHVTAHRVVNRMALAVGF